MLQAKGFLVTFWFVLLVFIGINNASASDAIGKVIVATGEFIAADLSGDERKLKRGSDVFMGDTLMTREGRAQVHFKDGANLSMRANSEIKIDEYYFKDAQKDDTSTMTLLKGGFRKITGAITENNPDGYKVQTAVAVMSIRGTIYESTLLGEDLGVEFIDGQKKLVIENDQGTIELFAGGPTIATVSLGKPPRVRKSMPDTFKDVYTCP